MSIKFNRITLFLAATAFAAASLSSCKKDERSTGWEYAPNMYNSEALEAQTQWREAQNNPHGMNMRLPAEGSIPRVNYNTRFVQEDSTVIEDLMLYTVPNDSLELAAKLLKNPIPWSEGVEKEGKVLYGRYCMHCHGENGGGDGKVAAAYKGVPVYSSDALKDLSGGHIFFVITHGKGRMWPHGSQISPEERWKIVHYVHRLQLGS